MLKNILNTPKKVILSIAILVLLLGFGLFIKNQLDSKWQALVFAYEKPSIVISVKKDYDIKQSKLDQSYTKPDKSAEDKLIEAVVSKLQSDSLK